MKEKTKKFIQNLIVEICGDLFVLVLCVPAVYVIKLYTIL